MQLISNCYKAKGWKVDQQFVRASVYCNLTSYKFPVFIIHGSSQLKLFPIAITKCKQGLVENLNRLEDEVNSFIE